MIQLLRNITEGKQLAEKIIIGSDHGGFRLKNDIIAHLKDKGFDVVDMGCETKESCDYPPIAQAVAKSEIGRAHV